MSEGSLSGGQVYPNAELEFKGFSNDHLTLSRLVKGFSYEIEIQKLLERNSFSFNCNPSNFEEWKRFVAKGADITLQINGKTIEIECKYLESVAYPSYVLRDYVTRFSSKSSLKITVTNNKWLLTYNAREVLKQFHSRLFNDYELVWYLVKLQHSNRNKYILNRVFDSKLLSSKLSTCSFDRVISSDDLKVKADSDLKIRLKSGDSIDLMKQFGGEIP